MDARSTNHNFFFAPLIVQASTSLKGTFLSISKSGEDRSIAQEVETVAPELVDVQGFGDEIPEDGIPLKGIFQTDLQYALMKSIQELKAINDTQAETINALTARIVALESK